MKWRISILAALALMLVFSGVSRADLLSGCPKCQGGTYLLQYIPTPVGTYAGGGKIYSVFFTIDTTNLSVPGASGIGSVAVKISNSDDLPPSTLVGAPGGVAEWTLQDGGLAANGCTGSGAGYICAYDAPIIATLPHAGLYTWNFQYATTGSLLTGGMASEVKVQFVNVDDRKVGDLVSNGITLQGCGDGQTETCGEIPPGGNPVPEPASVLLLGSLLGGTGLLLFRRRKA